VRTFARLPLLCFFGVLVVAAAASPAAGARAAARSTVAAVSADTPVSAHGGWVVWSLRSGSRWRLIAWRDGRIRTLPIAGRGEPFDADVGTDARGRAVVTFSRCDETEPEPGFAWMGQGCRLRLVDLASGRERALRVPRDSESSDTSPSMWRGRVAFARTVTGSASVSRVLLADARGRRLRRLPGGSTAKGCARVACAPKGGRFTVEGLDLGSKIVSFLWSVNGGGVAGDGGWEVRADRLSTGTGFAVGGGFLGEACTGGTDLSRPSTPTSNGDAVFYAQLTSACYQAHSDAASVRLGAHRASIAPLPGVVLRASFDARGGAALVAPGSQLPSGAACAPPAQPCSIVRLVPPALTQRSLPFGSPFA
jgi:hypothetical protein